VPLEVALQVITATPAAYLRLPAKGRIRAGADADLVLLDQDLDIDAVLARGQVMLLDHQLTRLGTFEQDVLDTLEHKKRFFRN
jgi:beta-aspartyl-dipeptidase (metallo-type)